MSTTATQVPSPSWRTDSPLGRLLAEVAPYITHATGRFTPLAGRYNAANSNPVMLNQVQTALQRAAQAGRIPKDLAGRLMVVADRTAGLARRSAAGYGASDLLARLEDGATTAAHYHVKVQSVGQTKANIELSMKEAMRKIFAAVQAIYQDPKAAMSALRKLEQACGGPGRTAEVVRETPNILCLGMGGLFSDGIKGGLFSSAERAAAMAAVPILAAAIEQRGRLAEQLDVTRETLRELELEPDTSPTLTNALKAHSALTTVRACVGGVDPLSAVMLREGAHNAALGASLTDINAAQDIPASYRAMMTDQAARRDAMQALQASRGTDRAVLNFQAATSQTIENGTAAKRLSHEGHTLAAQQAQEWSQQAHMEAAIAAGQILSDHVQHAMAAQAGILHTIEAFAAHHEDDMADALDMAAPDLPAAG